MRNLIEVDVNKIATELETYHGVNGEVEIKNLIHSQLLDFMDNFLLDVIKTSRTQKKKLQINLEFVD